MALLLIASPLTAPEEALIAPLLMASWFIAPPLMVPEEALIAPLLMASWFIAPPMVPEEALIALPLTASEEALALLQLALPLIVLRGALLGVVWA
jgi:hypothetical protein